MDTQNFLSDGDFSTIDPGMSNYSGGFVLLGSEDDRYHQEGAGNDDGVGPTTLVENPYPLVYLEGNQRKLSGVTAFPDGLGLTATMPRRYYTSSPPLGGTAAASSSIQTEPTLPQVPSLTSSQTVSSNSSNSGASRPRTSTRSPEPPAPDSSSKQNDNAVPPPNPPPKKGRSAGKRSKGRESAAATTTAAETTGSGDAVGSKKSSVLERNRVAALKCRQKKKEYVLELEEQRVGLESKHQALQSEYNTLLGEVSQIKNQLMDHASCNDPHIDKWLDLEARRFVEATNERYRKSYGGSPGAEKPHQQQITYEQLLTASSSTGGAGGGGGGAGVCGLPTRQGSVSDSVGSEGSRRHSMSYHRDSLPPLTAGSSSSQGHWRGHVDPAELTSSAGTSLQASPTNISFPLDIPGEFE